MRFKMKCENCKKEIDKNNIDKSEEEIHFESWSNEKFV